MSVTIQQIAEKAGVSRGTVDRALNNRGRINPEVAEMVKRTAEEMGYVHKARKRQKSAGLGSEIIFVRGYKRIDKGEIL